MWDSDLQSNYHSLQVAVNRSFSKGLSLKGAYTYSKAIGMADDNGWAGVNWDHVDVHHRNRARTGFDRRQTFQLGFVYELPFDDALSGPIEHGLGGWQASAILALLSGQTFDVQAPGSTLDAASAVQTADEVGAVRRLSNVGTSGTFDNTDAFAVLAGGFRFGASEGNILDRPGITNLGFSLAKNIPIGEKVNTQFRPEFFNLTNTSQFGRPDNNV